MTIRFNKELLAFLETEFTYEPETGLFRWLRSGHGQGGSFSKGDIAGTKAKDRVMLATNGICVRAHTLAYWFMTRSAVPDGMVIDHIDRNSNNNKWNNLRVVTRAFNNRNKDAMSNNTSGCAGVYNAGNGRWFARMMCGGIKHLGTYDTFEDAVRVRLQAEVKYAGEITSTHMAHLYDPEYTPKSRTTQQWREEEFKQGYRVRNGIKHRIPAAELRKHNVTD